MTILTLTPMPMPTPMTTTAVVLGVALFFLITRRLRPDLVAVLAMLALALSGVLDVEEALSGFSNPAVITVGAFLVLSRALRNLRWAERWGEALTRGGGEGGNRSRSGRSPRRLGLLTALGAGALSSVMQDHQAVAALLPAVTRAGRRGGLPPSKLLIPLAYGALLGRMLLLVGSPAALLVVWSMAAWGYAPFGVGDFLVLGLPLLLAGTFYLAFVGQDLLPWRRAEADPLDRFKVRARLVEFVVREGSPLVDQPLSQLAFSREYDLNVLGLTRREEPLLIPPAQTRLARGDVLLAEADPERWDELAQRARLEVVPRPRSGPGFSREDVSSGEIELIEVVVRPDSPLEGRTLRELDFRRRYGLSVLAVSRARRVIVDRLAELPLQGGDVMLVLGDRRRVELMLPEVEGIPLGERAPGMVPEGRPGWALAVILGAIGLAAFGVVPLPLAFLLGTVAVAAVARFPVRDAYRALDWPLLILLVGIVPWAVALQKSGLAARLAGGFVGLWAEPNPYVLLGALYLLGVGLATRLNAPVVAVILSPLALGMALELGVNPRPFLMMTALAASAAFLWPVGHRVHTLVWGVGGYLAWDYARVGLWLTALLGLLSLLLIPLIWPFYSP